jgi:hypothetical protein
MMHEVGDRAKGVPDRCNFTWALFYVALSVQPQTDQQSADKTISQAVRLCLRSTVQCVKSLPDPRLANNAASLSIRPIEY